MHCASNAVIAATTARPRGRILRMSRYGFRMNTALASLCLATLVLAGCASLPEGQRDARDPMERVNRSIYEFNDVLDRDIGTPLTRAYVKITPDPVETGISNFFQNLTYTETVVNEGLQLKPKPFLHAVARLLVNTTLGIGGLFDPATQLGIPSGDEDFGQTLGYWHVPAGPYIMLPILGPSSVRDAVGRVGDQFVDPKAYINDPWIHYGLWGFEQIDRRASLLPTDDVIKRAYDPYVFIRNAYLQRREYQVTDGAVKQEELEIFEEDPAPGSK
jgi:phospholipid-binding lipoprotein MlaA